MTFIFNFNSLIFVSVLRSQTKE